MEKVLVEISDIIQQYNKMSEIDGHELNRMIKNLTTRLYYLETKRSEFHNDFETIVFNETKEGNSVSRSVNTAHVKVPQLYQLRRIMDAGYRVVDAMRTNISFIKAEMQNIN